MYLFVKVNYNTKCHCTQDQINENSKNREALSQENLSLKLQYQEEREALRTNFANLTECNRGL